MKGVEVTLSEAEGVEQMQPVGARVRRLRDTAGKHGTVPERSSLSPRLQQYLVITTISTLHHLASSAQHYQRG